MIDDSDNFVPDPELRTGTVTLEVIGETILLLFVAGLFTAMFIESFSWPLGASLAPRIAIIGGTPFLLLRVAHLVRVSLRRRQTNVAVSQIMDAGFRIDGDPQVVRQRLLRGIAAIVALYVGIWVIGFHIMVPLWVFVYMYFIGKARFIWAAVWSLIFAAVIIWVYGKLLLTLWHDPLVFRLID